MPRRLALPIALLALAVAAPAQAATPWLAPQAVSTGVPALAPSFGPQPKTDLAVNDLGRAVAVWPGADFTLLTSRRAPDGTWTTPQVVSPAGQSVTKRGTTLKVAKQGVAAGKVVAGQTRVPLTLKAVRKAKRR